MAVAVGLVGAGSRAAAAHAPALASTPEIDFVGVWARRPAAVERLARRYDVRAFGQFGDLIASCEAVSFAVPPAVQSDLGSVAAGERKSVLLEVPIAWDTAGAEDLADAVAASHVVSQVALTWRYTDEVRSLLGEQASGPPPQGAKGRAVRALPAEPSGWRRERGVLLDLGPHVVDFLDGALGEIVDVDAWPEENGSVRLRLEHRLNGDSETSLATSTAVARDVAEFEFTGPNGSQVVDVCGPVTPATYTTMFSEFANAVRTGEPPALDVTRGLHIQRVVEAAETALLLGG